MRYYYTPIQRSLWVIIAVVAIMLTLSYRKKGRAIEPSDIRAELQKEPQQTPTSRKTFTINYRKVDYMVKPVANYELWGLVVSHNDINGFMDLSHDANSLDTKDLCVIWGSNLQSKDFQKVSFKSGDWTCYFRYPGGVSFDKRKLSNNHLITNSDKIRRMIAKVRIGDQVQFKGLLVNYRKAKHKMRWRNSSITRLDAGNHACEVVFVESLNILSRGTPGWYILYSITWWLLIFLSLLKVALFSVEAYFPSYEKHSEA